MSFVNRKEAILNYLRENQTATTKDLIEILKSSISTTRRDLIKLEQEGKIKRYHGGVTLSQSAKSQYNFQIEKIQNLNQKNIIGKEAKKLIKENQTLFLDSSTTVETLCQEIRNYKNLNIITNGLNIVKYFQNTPNIKCFITPGQLQPNTMTIAGNFTQEFFQNFHSDLTIISCSSINQEGIFENDENKLNVKKAMIKHTKKVILLCDTSKENTKGYMKLMDFKDIDVIISESKFSEKLENTIKETGSILIHP